MDFREIERLHELLKRANIPHTVGAIHRDGMQIRVYFDEEMTQEFDDAVLSPGSHGCEENLLETYALGNCEGYEIAEEVFEGWEKRYREYHNKQGNIYYFPIDKPPQVCYNTNRK